MALKLERQTYQILTKNDEVCIPRLSSILLAVWSTLFFICNWKKGSIIGQKLFRSSKIGRPTDLPMSDVPVFSPFFLGTIQSSLRNVSGWDLMTQCAKFFPKWRLFLLYKPVFLITVKSRAEVCVTIQEIRNFAS